MIDSIIFSKNRPLQLHCLLSSLRSNSNLKQIKVLHKYDQDFLESLELVKQLHADVVFEEEENFENQVKTFLRESNNKFCVFFVDDIVVKDPVDFTIACSVLENNPDILCFSLRLGLNLNYCYPMSQIQTIPNGIVNSQLFAWSWRGSNFDWGYPFSVDGHVFRRSELESWSSHLKFSNPNQFEAVLQQIPEIFAIPNGMACHVTSKIFNNPVNRVQEEFKNRNESSVSATEFKDIFLSGKEIDFTKFRGFMNNGAHTPVEFEMRNRK